jgi:triacylglycerol lipase
LPMSTFVELPAADYSNTAFDAFDPTPTQCSIGNARALMWLSQLAYETAKQPTVDAVAALWRISVTSFTRHKIGLSATFDTTGVIAEKDDAVILAFAGTDPGIWETLATDFHIRPIGGQNTHGGFQAAADAAQDVVREESDEVACPKTVSGALMGGASLPRKVITAFRSAGATEEMNRGCPPHFWLTAS